jgi:signal transduction histidine kinase
VTNIVRNATRVLRGFFVLRLVTLILGAVIYGYAWGHGSWSDLAPSEAFETPATAPWGLIVIVLSTVAVMLFLFVPWIEKRLGRFYLPAALALIIIVFTLESGSAYLHPRTQLIISLPTGRQIYFPWVQTEMILMTLVPCILAGAAYGLRGAVRAATLATLLHLVIGIEIWWFQGPLRGFVLSLLTRIAVLYGFTIIAGYLSDTWREEHRALSEANRQLRGYAATIEQLATSRERVRLARAMHDTLAHTLAAMVIQLEAVDALQEVDTMAAQAQLSKASQEARTGLEEARQAILDLRSAPVEEHGLDEALEQMVGRFGQRYGIHTTWALKGAPTPLLPVQANALYRITEEALSNVERHAGARCLDVSLEYDAGVTLSIHDDGAGFDPHNVDEGRYGLLGIRERATLVDGEIQILSAPGAGTTLIVRIAELWRPAEPWQAVAL